MAYEVEGYLKCSVNNRFNLGIKETDNQTNNNLVRLGAYTSTESIKIENGVMSSGEGGQSYTANSNLKVKYVYNNGNMKLYIEDTLVYDTSVSFYPKYICMSSYSSSKTVSVSDLKIKPL